jgi:hypothetical protein
MLPIMSLNGSVVLTACGNKTLNWTRQTVSHLSIIVILTPPREHFPVRLKFTAAVKN